MRIEPLLLIFLISATFTLRILVFPLVVTARKNALKLHENSAQLEYLQNKVNVANLQGDVYLSKIQLEFMFGFVFYCIK